MYKKVLLLLHYKNYYIIKKCDNIVRSDMLLPKKLFVYKYNFSKCNL